MDDKPKRRESRGEGVGWGAGINRMYDEPTPPKETYDASKVFERKWVTYIEKEDKPCRAKEK